MVFAVNLRTHQHWEDWLGILLGIFIALAPWPFLIGEMQATSMQYIALNAMIAGLLIASLSALEIEVVAPWEEWAAMVLGLWVAVSPWLLAYANINDLMVAHVVFGLMVAGLAALELWQDRHRPTTAE
jgi:hypothetical protein